ncbi:AI-2E family transporter [Mesorhizobium sp. L-8-3]|uniref:AI-2E family transporter n=1 Tax=Mesorhizobium sp. L-8-3 TaxID=2744522 RepID=UPI001925B760|nr:AI-2E family transporter [Mesorhizobium sp. L-8-3]BCH24946.1 AI-2E family transporter [Mesorhizobium sp. L-8-3]
MRQASKATAAGGGMPALEARATDLVIRLAFLGLFAYWSIELVRPFLPVVIWAVLLAVALYPAYAWLARRLGGRQSLAAAIITGLALLTILGPVSMLAASLVETVQWLAAGLQAGTLRVPPPPAGVADWPVVGEQAHEAWALASTSLDDALKRYGTAVLPAGGTILGKIAAIGGDILKFVVSVVIMGFLFRPGARLAEGARAFAGRLVAPRGAHFVDLAGATIRNVSRGVIGVALLQTLMAGIVLVVAGVPGAGLLAFGILIFCTVQIGPAPVLVPTIIWAWTAMSAGAALILTLVLVPVMLVDNVLKPILIARGLTTPILVILTGVIGGTITYGLVGLFLGPIVLAVFYELVVAWVRLEDPGAS